MHDTTTGSATDVAAIRMLIEEWATAVRAKDFDAILAHHAVDLSMFDVPPPMESRGIQGYRDTWDLFYSAQPEPVAFDIQRMEIVAGVGAAFVVALMQCAQVGPDGQRSMLDFRLTVGLRKINGRWIVVHEHHSVPAE